MDDQERGPAIYASYPDRSKGRVIEEAPSPTRNAFQRDRDRIIHSAAFRRLQYKTQVFVIHEGDHFRTRLTHTLEVGQIARSLARALHVQEDLAEAVALAHDLGHPPFAHCGEDALQICLKDLGGFNHNEQSLRVVTLLEKKYAAFEGLNLSWEILEGMAKHNGPLDPAKKVPPTIVQMNKQNDFYLDQWTSLEAQVANLADDIAYNNHDIDDGLRAGFFKVKDLYELPVVGAIAREIDKKYPKLDRTRKANEITRRFMGVMVADVLDETKRRLAVLKPKTVDDIRRAGKPMAAFSDELAPTVLAVRKFLRANVYEHWKVLRLRGKMSRVVEDLFNTLYNEPRLLPPEWSQLLPKKDDPMARARVVTDYVAGMTDRYALKEHARLFDLYALEGLPSA